MPIAPYKRRVVALPNLANTARIDQLMRDGKLYLSMNDTVALALENNLDIAISRYNLNIADTDIWRADAGNAIRGVNTGVLQGTPGGQGVGVGTTSTGGGAGGTTAGIGGVGTGTAGQVLSTTGVGAPIPQFDPTLTSTLQLDQNRIQSSSPFSNPFTSTHTATWDFAYQQGFHWGTNLTVAFNNIKNTADSSFQAYSPQYNSNFRAAVTQPLLAGFGMLPNTRFIKIAKNNRAISDFAFRLQVISTVNQVQNIYWDLVNAYESVKVQQESLALAEKTLSDNKKQVEIGTLAPIEVVRAQSVVATNQQSLIVAQTSLQLQQLLIKNALSRTLVDPVLADAEVIPTDTMAVPEKEPVSPTEDLVKQALTNRQELAELRLDLKNREIGIRSAKNNLLPAVNLFAYYQGSGLGGSQNANYACLVDPTNPICATVRPTPNISYAGTLNQLVDSTAPDKGIGLQLNIPIRNRSAQSDQVRAELEYRQAQISLQQGENRVRIEVRNAQFSVQQNRAAVDAAKAAVELGRQSLDAEQKKYALGASTTTLVLGAQRDLTQSESNLVSAMSAYEKSRVELDRAIGATLDRTGIIMNDAVRGEVTKMPGVPYVAPRPPEQQTPVQPQVQPQQQPQQ
jgi:outer membrane protein TolC